MDIKKILIKYGGNAMTSQNLKSEIASQVSKLASMSNHIVMVHGGGPFITKALQKANLKSEFYEGQRITTKEAFHLIQQTLIGEVNSDLVSVFNQAGLKSIGLSGKDGKVVTAEKFFLETKDKKDPPIDLGHVGKVQQVDPSLIFLLLKHGYTPLLTCIASDEEGNSYNINGDTFAGKIASAIHADIYIVLTDVDGLYADYPDPESIFREMKIDELAKHYGHAIQGGMIPKIKSCEEAVRAGVKKAVILNGTKPDQISRYILGNESIGTTLTA
jgi:acetylglutamate kinase